MIEYLFREAVSDLLCLAKWVLCGALMLAPYAIDAAIDKWLANTLPPTVEKEPQP